MKYYILKVSLIIFLLCPVTVKSKCLKIFLTSNLEGRFSFSINEKSDSLLRIGESIYSERKKAESLHIDLGNAFYPGALSKYSYGAVVFDFFDSINCNASLVSSGDLRLGVENLKFQLKEKFTKLVSANICQSGSTVFKPYFIHSFDNKKIAFIGLTSTKTRFDIAEKKINKIQLKPAKEVLKLLLEELSEKNVDSIIILSGMETSENIEFLTEFKAVDLIISGGDNRGDLFASSVERINFSDGRSLLTATNSLGYYILTICGDSNFIESFEFKTVDEKKKPAYHFEQFRRVLDIWKFRFSKEKSGEFLKIDQKVVLENKKLAHLLRDKFKCDIAVVSPVTVKQTEFNNIIFTSDLMNIIYDEYNIFSYKLLGAEIISLLKDNSTFVNSGLIGQKVKGYAVKSKEYYKIVSTQVVFEDIEKKINRKLGYKNHWTNISDLLVDDIKNKKIILKNNYSYLDNRFSGKLAIKFENIFYNTEVDKDEESNTPAGMPGESYQKWGYKNKMIFDVYNQFHFFSFEPYIYYLKEAYEDDTEYRHNLLRGTFIYKYNMSDSLKPYNKFQYDTVVKRTENGKPTEIRETMGADLTFSHFNLKTGLGFEKKIKDDAKDIEYGIENILNFKYNLWGNWDSFANLDTFLSFDDRLKKNNIKADFEIGFSCQVNKYMLLSLKYKYYYNFSGDLDKVYKNQQTLLALDVNFTTKIF